MWLSINKVPFAQTRECLVVCCEIKNREQFIVSRETEKYPVHQKDQVFFYSWKNET